MKKLLATTFLCLSMSFSFGQDTLSIMYYNLLKFPNVNSARISYLEEILHYVQPDIFVVNELTSGSGANSILTNALNTQGVTNYAGATWIDGPDDENMLYYNTDKLGFISQTTIPTTLRDIDEYILYYKHPGLTAQSDTAYLYIYGLHLKAGNSGSDENQRTAEATTLKSFLVNRANPENTIVGGDFNIYTSTEGAYNMMTASSQADLYDPLGPGNYHNNSLFSNIFTQSTRVSQFDGGSTGGMDDRFDMMFISDDMLTGANGVQFLSNSYTAIGQDGLRWNQSLIFPANSSEPANIINALYYMSDHLPIYMEMAVGGELSVEENDWKKDVRVYPIPANETIHVASNHSTIESIKLLDMQGRIVLESQGNELAVTNVKPGAYLVQVITVRGSLIKKVLVE